jgi:hydrogenase/urease accessory protein HupE
MKSGIRFHDNRMPLRQRRICVCGISFNLKGFGKICLVILVVALCSGGVFAHNPMSSWAVARIYSDRVELDAEISAESAWALLGGDPNVAPNVRGRLPELKEIAPQLYRVLSGGTQLATQSAEIEVREEDGVGFLLVYCKPPGEPLRFDADFLRKLPGGHRTTLTLKDADEKVLRTQILTSSNNSLEMSVFGSPSTPDRSSSFWSFLKLGLEHILTGYDHLLFLFGLLLACRRFSTAVRIITCFTLAHSLTLGLAALNVVSMPGRIVEPLIAASIVFVGIENIVRSDEPRWRWALTFVLGLVHGFGFAGALKEAGLGSNGSALLVPLFSFNLGVELGQVAVAALLLPILWKLSGKSFFEKYGRTALSAAIALAGLYWFVTRLLL